jgi:hypothetical protein
LEKLILRRQGKDEVLLESLLNRQPADGFLESQQAILSLQEFRSKLRR